MKENERDDDDDDEETISTQGVLNIRVYHI